MLGWYSCGFANVIRANTAVCVRLCVATEAATTSGVPSLNCRRRQWFWPVFGRCLVFSSVLPRKFRNSTSSSIWRRSCLHKSLKIHYSHHLTTRSHTPWDALRVSLHKSQIKHRITFLMYNRNFRASTPCSEISEVGGRSCLHFLLP
jgi:hypothetical protein